MGHVTVGDLRDGTQAVYNPRDIIIRHASAVGVLWSLIIAFTPHPVVPSLLYVLIMVSLGAVLSGAVRRWGMWLAIPAVTSALSAALVSLCYFQQSCAVGGYSGWSYTVMAVLYISLLALIPYEIARMYARPEKIAAALDSSIRSLSRSLRQIAGGQSKG